jgi:HAD superfamily hydrolase (TIGR01509 family)
VTAPIDAVFLDFAGTLFSDRALRDVHLRQLQFVAQEAGCPATVQELRQAYKQGMGVAFRTVATGPFYSHRAMFGAAFVAMAQALGGSVDAETANAAVDRQYQATIDSAVLRPDCSAMLNELRGDGIHVQIVSNIDDEQLDGLLDSFGIADLVDEATSSQAAGSCKPDAGIYRFALAKAGREPATVLFVGDSLSHDIEGPAALGIRTAWLSIDAKAGRTGTADAYPDYVIDSLAEIPTLVRGTGGMTT